MSKVVALSQGQGDVLIRGGRVIDRRGERAADVAITGSRITAVEPALDPADSPAAMVLDASGCIVSPGFVDLHVHLREPGHEEAETIQTGARGAALGGFTAVVAMPNTTPDIDCAAVVSEVNELARHVPCDVYPSAAITVGRQGEQLTPMAELVRAGVRIFTDDGRGVQDERVMRSALEYASGLSHLAGGAPIVLAQHCEVESLSRGGSMHEGEWSSRLGIAGQPAEAEDLMVMRDIALARLSGARVHFQHVSTARSLEQIRAARAAGIPVTAEATTHHFTLDHSCCASFNPVFKVHPPLRTAEDTAAVKAALADGTVDAIATDHAPHTADHKQRPFADAPPGMLGLETAFALANTELDLPIERLLALLSWQPAAIAGIDDAHGGPIEAGRPANLCVIDPDHAWTVSGAAMASRSSNTPYEGRQVRGRIRHTVLHGEPVVIDAQATR